MSDALAREGAPDEWRREALGRAVDALPTLEEAELDQTTAAVREIAQASTAAYARHRDAVRAALASGMTQVAVARRTGLSQGRIAQLAKS
ncbi:hypothetical protein [Brachybacterium paraconglomeratum]|uniref:hypothetical protein n=1 Tax=Brachybacterium paraconglomeratum TaxID=173362 RepID=UPI0022B06295|nr:hypothetical protein [Brachybacterium paraconglomeratum]MCZ4326767.1 hypothetical protein [Brachybacterium paraconglomeratum]